MNHSIKKTLLVSFVFLVALLSTLYGLDFGATLDNSSSITVGVKSGTENSELTYYQQNKLALWFQSELGKYLDFYIQGSYSYKSDLPYLFDIDTLTLKGSFPKLSDKGLKGVHPSLFSFILGRFQVADPTSYVLNHRIDGIELTFGYPNSLVNIDLGYTGFLLKPTSAIILSKADANDLNESNVMLASPRLIGLFEITFPDLYRQSLSFAFIFQEDMRGMYANVSFLKDIYPDTIISPGEKTLQPTDGGLIDTQYLGMKANGPVVSSLYYMIFGYLGTGRVLTYIESNKKYEYKPILSGIGGIRLRYFLPFMESYTSISYVYATGDSTDSSIVEGNTDEIATAFNPISNNFPSGVVFSPNFKNISIAKSEFSIKPFANSKSNLLNSLQAVATLFAFFRNTTGPISESGLNPESENLFLGTESDIIINWRPLSDVGLSIANGLFIPNNSSGGAFDPSQRGLEYRGVLNLSISL